jgi:hypothetical protein
MSAEIMHETEPLDAAAHRQAAADLPVMDAAEAAEKLRRGERVERVCIRRLKLEGDFPKPLELSHVVLDRPEIRLAVFHGPVNFSRAEVIGLSFGKGPTVFEQGLTFKSCTVRRMRMDFVTVQGSLSFDNSDVYGTIKLNRCEFGGTHAWEAKFHGWFEMKDCTVRGVGDFRSCHVEEGMILQGSTFAGTCCSAGCRARRSST